MRNLRSSIKFEEPQMVRGCISANSIGNLIFIDYKIDKWSYLNMLKNNLEKN